MYQLHVLYMLPYYRYHCTVQPRSSYSSPRGTASWLVLRPCNFAAVGFFPRFPAAVTVSISSNNMPSDERSCKTVTYSDGSDSFVHYALLHENSMVNAGLRTRGPPSTDAVCCCGRAGLRLETKLSFIGLHTSPPHYELLVAAQEHAMAGSLQC